MRITVLASGSKGNASLIEFKDQQYLIDCGLTYRQLKLRLNKQNKSLTNLKGIFITHEHRDHVSGLRVLLNNHQVPIYLSEGTYKGLDKRYTGTIDDRLIHLLRDEELIDMDGFKLLPFNTYHDAIEPFGFKFIEGEHSFVYMTDTGYFPLRKYDLIRNASVYMIESNYESELLLESARPWMLKRRILDDQGHLSNEDSANLLLDILGNQTKTIILAHLSEDCNRHDLAKETYHVCFNLKKIDLSTYNLLTAKQHESLDEIIIE
ncbi:MAG TPA: MBL fold metallo-hydrolase [Candidatus Izemoplasmatales bacterium]|nr:MBL fold metallo-hydrolase [Candidatus Izemoplasmatales bacterium]